MSFKAIIPASILAIAFASFVTPHVARADMADTVKMLDSDSDGTVSLEEIQAAAAKKFGTLDPDNDSTIDAKEAKGAMKKGAFKKTDSDNDGTVDKTEYSAVVEKLFKKADKNDDGTLDAKELASKAGQKLLKLVQ